MKDTLVKLRALVTMKSTLIAAIQESLAQARVKIILLEDEASMLEGRVLELEKESAWWKSLDESMARRETEARADEVHVDVTLKEILAMPDFDLEDH